MNSHLSTKRLFEDNLGCCTLYAIYNRGNLAFYRKRDREAGSSDWPKSQPMIKVLRFEMVKKIVVIRNFRKKKYRIQRTIDFDL